MTMRLIATASGVSAPATVRRASARRTSSTEPVASSSALVLREPAVDLALQDGGEQLALVLVAGIERRLADAGRFGDRIDARSLEAALHEHRRRDRDQALVALDRFVVGGPPAGVAPGLVGGRGGHGELFRSAFSWNPAIQTEQNFIGHGQTTTCVPPVNLPITERYRFVQWGLGKWKRRLRTVRG